MTTLRGSTLIGKIVVRAKILGELHHRRFLITEQLKGLDAQAREDSVFRRRETGRIAESRRADYVLALEEHRLHLAHMKFLAQEELGQVQRLSSEIEKEMGESIGSLKKRLA
jgi:hypothetical protein